MGAAGAGAGPLRARQADALDVLRTRPHGARRRAGARPGGRAARPAGPGPRAGRGAVLVAPAARPGGATSRGSRRRPAAGLETHPPPARPAHAGPVAALRAATTSSAALVRPARPRRGRRAGFAVVITGEPGIGKSRLCAELAARARARGATVLAGRCSQDDGPRRCGRGSWRCGRLGVERARPSPASGAGRAPAGRGRGGEFAGGRRPHAPCSKRPRRPRASSSSTTCTGPTPPASGSSGCSWRAGHTSRPCCWCRPGATAGAHRCPGRRRRGPRPRPRRTGGADRAGRVVGRRHPRRARAPPPHRPRDRRAATAHRREPVLPRGVRPPGRHPARPGRAARRGGAPPGGPGGAGTSHRPAARRDPARAERRLRDRSPLRPHPRSRRPPAPTPTTCSTCSSPPRWPAWSARTAVDTFVFEHALVRDTAYDAVSPTRRARGHAAVAGPSSPATGHADRDRPALARRRAGARGPRPGGRPRPPVRSRCAPTPTRRPVALRRRPRPPRRRPAGRRPGALRPPGAARPSPSAGGRGGAP